MTPEEERKQFREVFFLKETVERLEKESWDRDKRLRRAEDRVSSLGAGLAWLAAVFFSAVFGYLIFYRHNDFWDWLGIAVGVVIVFLGIREAIRNFEKS